MTVLCSGVTYKFLMRLQFHNRVPPYFFSPYQGETTSQVTGKCPKMLGDAIVIGERVVACKSKNHSYVWVIARLSNSWGKSSISPFKYLYSNRLLNTEKEVKCIVHLKTRFLAETKFYNLELGGLSQRNPSQHSLVHKHWVCQNNIFQVENRQPCASSYNLLKK